MNILKQNLKPFLITTSLFSSFSFGYLYMVAKRNADELQSRKDNELEFKDNTRPQNQYFGLSYGFRADQIVLDRLDSGDFLYMKFEAMECTSVLDICRCLIWQLTKPYPHFDSFGIVFRDNINVYVLYDKFGSVLIEDYATFLQNPYWSEISVRKLIGAKEIHKSLKPIFYDDTKHYQFTQKDYISQILYNTGIVKNQDQIYIEDLDVDNPALFSQGMRLGPKINVRTKRNRDLDYK